MIGDVEMEQQQGMEGQPQSSGAPLAKKEAKSRTNSLPSKIDYPVTEESPGTLTRIKQIL